VLPLFVPPLRDRPEDIIPFTRHFLKQAASAPRREVPTLSREVSAALRDYAWPGNVRELRHAIERAMQAADGGAITLDHLPVEILEAAAFNPDTALARRPTLDEVERRYIIATLQFARGSQTDAARILGISRKALWEKRKRYGLD
jgi:DNA-binding NtrC family response regulator